jgi:hypothetical protein
MEQGERGAQERGLNKEVKRSGSGINKEIRAQKGV